VLQSFENQIKRIHQSSNPPKSWSKENSAVGKRFELMFLIFPALL